MIPFYITTSNQDIMKILITGSAGQLGQSFQELAKTDNVHEFLFADKNELNVLSEEAVRQFIKHHQVECIINCAAYTAVDLAESDPLEARDLNVRGASVLSKAASEVNAIMVQIGTDYIFDGKACRPYNESANTNPLSSYGRTKLDAEIEVLLNAKRSVIIRTSWLYSPYGQNFVKTILKKGKEEKRLRVVYDQVGSPTYAPDLAKAIIKLIPTLSKRVRGEIYNYSNEGVCSWFDMAVAIAEMAHLPCEITPVLTKEIKTLATRPHYSVLDKSRIKNALNSDIPYWRDSLRACIDMLSKNGS